jgi:hypothetical protein
MEGRADTGVKGFFSDYSKAPAKATPLKVEQPKPEVPAPPAVPVKRAASSKAEKVKARVGRPPGVVSGSRSHKVKATMHVNAALLDFYRDWSWEARCNLGELIERAMVAYKSSRGGAGNKKTART